MKPCSCISLMPSSVVTFQTPAWVVTGTFRSRATSNAAFSGNSGLPGTSKAIWKPSMSLPPLNRLATKSRNSGAADHAHRADPVAGHQDIRAVLDPVRVVHGQHGGVAEHQRPAQCQVR